MGGGQKGKAALDLDHNAFDIRHYIVVCEAENSISIFGKPTVPLLVIGLTHVMRISVKLNDQPRVPAKEVSEVRANGHLPAEFTAADFSP